MGRQAAGLGRGVATVVVRIVVDVLIARRAVRNVVIIVVFTTFVVEIVA
ncbi:MAG: hypothetical protein V3V08_00350 [Nannocystaceae bacterium]